MPTLENETQGQLKGQGFLRRPHFAVAIQGGLLSVRVQAESQPTRTPTPAPVSASVDETRPAP